MSQVKAVSYSVKKRTWKIECAGQVFLLDESDVKRMNSVKLQAGIRAADKEIDRLLDEGEVTLVAVMSNESIIAELDKKRAELIEKKNLASGDFVFSDDLSAAS